MEETKAQTFRKVMTEVQQYLMSQEQWHREDELDLYDKLIDAWHEPTVFGYNLLGPNPHPPAIISQYEWAKRVPKGQVYLLLGLPAYYMQIDKNELWRNRAKYYAGLEDDDEH